jgi:5-(carboxyamino)imidazole ribonucleotide synthase
VKTIGIIGAGQLGQMLGYAAEALEARCVFLDPAAAPPAGSAGTVISLPFDSPLGLAELARQADVISYEFENVPVAALQAIPADVTVYPPAEALALSQDRLVEKELFESSQIPLPEYRVIDSESDLRIAALDLGLPIVLKTRRLGYDGKGQRVIKHENQMGPAFDQLGGSALIAEQWVDFDLEVSAIGVRRPEGEIATYALTENLHRDGILRESRAPANLPNMAQLADEYLNKLLERLNYVGVLALELFVVGERLLANEIAPRVHNSGHWTIEGAVTSQFENHLRAILDLPLGDTSMLGHAGMVNLIGQIPDNVERLLDPYAILHDYGKSPRPGRKLGHITVLTNTREMRDESLKSLQLATSIN